MTIAAVAASGLLAVILTLALAREVRLRRALQALLARIFRTWRNANGTNSTNTPRDDDRSHADATHRNRM
jgi:hypothetical protein